MRILICRSNPVDPDPRVEKISKSLVNGGHQVVVLAWDRTASLETHEVANEIDIYRIPIRANFATGLGNLPNLLIWQFKLFLWLLRNRNTFDVIHACDFDTVVPAVILKWLFKKKLVYDIFDFYADHLRKTPGLIKSLIIFVDLRIVKIADAVILVDHARLEQLRGVVPARWEAIYNTPQKSVDLNEHPTTSRPKTSRLHLAYVGLLQVERGLFEVLNVLKKRPSWSLDIGGFGGDEDKIAEIAEELQNVRWYGRIPYDQSLKLSGGADLLFATYDPLIENHRYSSANKLFEAMMLGKPIIVCSNTNMDRIVEENQCGLVVEYGDETALETALSKLENDLTYRDELGKNARRAYDQFYSWTKMEEKLLNLYEELDL